MKERNRLFLAFVVMVFGMQGVVSGQEKDAASQVNSALDFAVEDISGEKVELEKYLGNVVIIVNVASKCGYTPQYESLQELYKTHEKDGLVILGFPCNQFGGQEPGTEAEIQEFCKMNYGVKFDLFSKIDVKGDQQAPLYEFLTTQDTSPLGSGTVRWNFEKFVVDRNGQVSARFGTKVSPDSKEFVEHVTTLLNQEAGSGKKDGSQ